MGEYEQAVGELRAAAAASGWLENAMKDQRLDRPLPSSLIGITRLYFREKRCQQRANHGRPGARLGTRAARSADAASAADERVGRGQHEVARAVGQLSRVAGRTVAGECDCLESRVDVEGVEESADVVAGGVGADV